MSTAISKPVKPLSVQLLQHVAFEGPGSIETWVRERGHVLSRTELFSGAALPRATDLDWLVVMGGPMGVLDEAAYPWLSAERLLISEAIRREKTVVGICLGAQLIASVLGASVYPGAHKEIGWYPLYLTPEGKSDPAGAALGGTPTVFHWHGDTFEVPRGAVHLAYSEACRHQGFRYGRRVLGLQFHLEMEAESLAGMIRHGAGELSEPGKGIQPVNELAGRPEWISDNRARLFQLLDDLAATR